MPRAKIDPNSLDLFRNRDTYRDVGFDRFIERKFPGLGLEEFKGVETGVLFSDEGLGGEGEVNSDDFVTKQKFKEHTEDAAIHGLDFVTDLVFTVSDNNTVTWVAGNITYRDGQETVEIASGTTDNMAAATFIYYDPYDSPAELVKTTSYEEAIKEDRLLVAVATLSDDANNKAELVVFGGSLGGHLGNSLSGALWVIDGGGSAITAGLKDGFSFPFDCGLKRIIMLADQSGDVVVDFWVKALASGYPPTNTESITGGNEPTISSDDNVIEDTFTSWTQTSFSRGDVIFHNIDSVATITRLAIIYELIKDT